VAWKTVAQATSVEELRALTPSVADIPNGSQMLITIELPAWLPLAYIANLPVEWITQRFLGALRVTDVRAGGFNTIEIHGIAQGVLWMVLLPILIAVLKGLTIAGLLGFTIYAIKEITVSFFETTIAPAEAEKARAEAEEAKAEATTEALKAGYSLTEITAWLEGLKSPPPEYKSIIDRAKESLSPTLGISAGVLLLIGLALFLFMGRR